MTGLLDLFVITGVVLVDGLLLAGAGALGVWLWRRLGGSRGRDRATTTHQSRQIALDIVQERYERGEIDAAELEGRRALLRRER